MQRNQAFFLSLLLGLALPCSLPACSATAPMPRQPDSERPALATAPLEAVARAEQLYAEARFEPARQAFHSLAGQFPRNAYFWFRLGNCSVQMKRYSEAAQAFEQARLLDPSDGRFAYNLAIVHSALARDAFVQARTQLPPHSPWRQEAEQNRRLLEAVMGAPPAR